MGTILRRGTVFLVERGHTPRCLPNGVFPRTYGPRFPEVCIPKDLQECLCTKIRQMLQLQKTGRLRLALTLAEKVFWQQEST